MLDLPTKFTPSAVELGALCDWIEGSVLFTGENKVSESDIIDVLLENHIYLDKSQAEDKVANAWSELRKRHSCFGKNGPFIFKNRFISKSGDTWKVLGGYSFCLLLSLSRLYSSWAKQFGNDFSDQAELFERLTKEALTSLFPGWNSHITGWSRIRPNKLQAVVKKVSDLLGETEGDVKRWSDDSAKDAGLDIICYYQFPDRRGGFPVFFFQCASGINLTDKYHTPEMSLWHRLIEFPTDSIPYKAFSTPLAFSDQYYPRTMLKVNGLLFDRFRLYNAVNKNDKWISATLLKDIARWGNKRANKLPIM